MRSIVLQCVFTAAAIAATGCNFLIGADEPDVVQDPAGEDGDVEGGGEPADPCGNGVVDEGEECDDGNVADDDACSRCVASDCAGPSEVKEHKSGRCYLITSGHEATWDEAKAACVAWGGTLAALTTVDEFAFVQQRVRENTWIGGFDPAGTMTYEWVTGEPWEFESWAEARPEESHVSCVLIEKELLAFWDADCTVKTSGYACERGPAGAP